MSGYCKCGGVLGSWLDGGEYPFVRQGVMHSPLGCARRLLTAEDCYFYIEDLAGYVPEQTDMRVLFQMVMWLFAQHGSPGEWVVLADTPKIAWVAPENRVPATRRQRGGGSVGVRHHNPPAVPVTWDPSTGRVKPPWVK